MMSPMRQIVTEKPLPPDLTSEDIQREIELQLLAGASRSWVERRDGRLVLRTEWPSLERASG